MSLIQVNVFVVATDRIELNRISCCYFLYCCYCTSPNINWTKTIRIFNRKTNHTSACSLLWISLLWKMFSKNIQHWTLPWNFKIHSIDIQECISYISRMVQHGLNWIFCFAIVPWSVTFNQNSHSHGSMLFHMKKVVRIIVSMFPWRTVHVHVQLMITGCAHVCFI